MTPVGAVNPQLEQVSTSGTLATRIPPSAKSHGHNNKGRSDLSGNSGHRRNNSIYYRIGSTGWGMGIPGMYLVRTHPSPARFVTACHSLAAWATHQPLPHGPALSCPVRAPVCLLTVFLPHTLRCAGARRRKGRKRVMLLMSDTGGGHRASAQAIMAGFQKLYGDKYEVCV